MWIPTNDYLESHRQLLCKLVLIDKFSFSSKGSLNSQHFLRFSPWSGNHRLVLITCHRPTPTAQFSKTMRKKRFTQNTSETRFSKRRGKHKNYRSPVCNLCFFFYPCRVRNVLARFSWLQHGETPVENRIADAVPRKEIFKLLTHAGLVNREDFPYA